MRLSILCFFIAIVSLCQSQQFYTNGFINQDFYPKEWKTIERFGASEAQVLAMGHEKFVTWYGEDSRGGKDSRVQAEKVYYLALLQSNAPLLLKLPRKEQAFMEGMITRFGDMAKSCFTAGIMGSKEGDAWSLTIRETSTAVAEAIHAVLNPAVPVRKGPKVDIDPIFEEASKRIAVKYPSNAEDGKRLKFLAEYIMEHFKDRSEREKTIARNFNVQMAKISIFNPYGAN